MLKRYEVEVLEVLTYETGVKLIKFEMDDSNLQSVLYRTIGRIGLNAGLKNNDADIIGIAMSHIKEDKEKIILINEIFDDSDICYEDQTYTIMRVTCEQEVLYETNTETVKM